MKFCYCCSVLPDDFSIHLAGFHSERLYEEHIGYWSDVYGFEMNIVAKNILADGHVMIVPAEDITTSDCCIKVNRFGFEMNTNFGFFLDTRCLHMFEWWYCFHTFIYRSSIKISFYLRFCLPFRCQFCQESYWKSRSLFASFEKTSCLLNCLISGTFFDLTTINTNSLETNSFLSSTSLQSQRRRTSQWQNHLSTTSTRKTWTHRLFACVRFEI